MPHSTGCAVAALAASSGGTHDDDMNIYSVVGHSPDERVFFGKVEHRYGDGALKLTQKTINLAVKEGEKLP